MILEKIAETVVGKIAEKIFDSTFSSRNNDQISNIKDYEQTNSIQSEKIKNLDEQKVFSLDELRSSFIKRIHNLFNVFGLSPEEIPLVLKDYQISYKDVFLEEALLEKFNDEIFDYLSNYFKINKNWLYAKSNDLYISHERFYKRSGIFCKELRKKQPERIYVLSERIPNALRDTQTNDNAFCILAEYSAGYVNGHEINTYELLSTDCRYGYWRCRYELKRLLLCLKKNGGMSRMQGLMIKGFHEKIKNFQEGKTSFSFMIRGGRRWYGEDYVTFPHENGTCLYEELEELQKIYDEYDSISSY